MIKGLVVAVVALGISLPVLAKDHAAEYQIGTFDSTGQLSDGTFMQCAGHACTSWSAGHNVHYVRTETGLYAIQAPVSVGKSFAAGMLMGPLAPTIHKEWFMDQLHEGDKILFYTKCNKHNNCEFWLPDPDKTGKEFITIGYYRADVAKTNTTTLCGKGKLSPQVEAQVCPARSAYVPTPAPSAATQASTAPTSSATLAGATPPPAQSTQPATPGANPNQRGPVTHEKW